MSMSKRIRCKYFAQGSCYKGESCDYLHDKKAPSHNICNFYQKGICSYGSRCRYEHIKPAVSWHPASTSSATAQSKVKDSVSQDLSSRIPSGGAKSRHSSVGDSPPAVSWHPASTSTTTAQFKVKDSVPQDLSSRVHPGGAKSRHSSVGDSSPSVPCRLWHGASSSSAHFKSKVSDPICGAFGKLNVSSKSTQISSSKRPLVSENYDNVDIGSYGEFRSGKQVNISICPLAADGNCPRGENCRDVHGDLCSTCGKYCLHPFIPQEREEHIKACEKKKKQLEALKLSQEVECSVCFDCVLSKPTAAERKFGILSECDHPFCVTCIRNWRRSSPSSGMDVNSALRACPICRKVSYFVVPSDTWFTTKEEKAEIIDNYKERLKSIDCKHFSFGNGNCPFGTSCFYKHTVKPGSYAWIHNRPPPPRRRGNHINMGMFDMFDLDMIGDLIGDANDDGVEDMFYTLEDLIDPSDFGIDENNPFEMAYLLHHLGFDTSDDDACSSEGEDDDDDDDEY